MPLLSPTLSIGTTISFSRRSPRPESFRPPAQRLGRNRESVLQATFVPNRISISVAKIIGRMAYLLFLDFNLLTTILCGAVSVPR